MIPTKWNCSGIGPRSLTPIEVRILGFIAEMLSEEDKSAILDDVPRLSVRASEDGTLLEFDIEGYERPPYSGQHTFDIDVDVCVDDIDGAHISIILFGDQNSRVLELEYLRWDFEEIRAPLWETLRAGKTIQFISEPKDENAGTS
jgi:hypothetical protein